MSRRDTIIIAVLINAGLLVVLFSTALKSNKSEEVAATVNEQAQMPLPQTSEIPMQRQVAVANTAQDEVDQLLRQFSQTPVVEPTATSAVTVAVSEQKSHFVQELNGTAFQPVATPLQEQPAAATPASFEVVVKKGDVLEKIARTHHTTVDEIMKTNRLTSTRLKIGQVLKIASRSNHPSTGNEKKRELFQILYGEKWG